MRNLLSKGSIPAIAHFFLRIQYILLFGFFFSQLYKLRISLRWSSFHLFLLWVGLRKWNSYFRHLHFKTNISLHKIGLCDGCFQVTLLTNSFLCERNHDMISELFLVLSPITAQKRNEGSSFEIQSFLIDLHFSAPLHDGNKPILRSIFSSDLTLSDVKNMST